MTGSRSILAFMAYALVSTAHASDGTINFDGLLTGQTCIATINGINAATVTLPTLSTGALSSAGNTAGATNFEIKFSKCSSELTSAVAFFEAGATVNTVTKNLRNTDSAGAKNVEIQLIDNIGSIIPVGDGTQAGVSARRATISSGVGSLQYSARYIAVGGPSTSGKVTSLVTYSINYQ